MKKHILEISVVFALILVATFLAAERNCSTTTTNVAQPAADAFSANGPQNGGATHCLVYGKYCLSNTLRSG